MRAPSVRISNIRSASFSSLPTFGFSTSPLVDGDRLLIEAGGPEGKAYAALAKKTGEVEWTAGETEDGPGYSSPIAVEMNGRRGYVYVLGNKMAKNRSEDLGGADGAGIASQLPAGKPLHLAITSHRFLAFGDFDLGDSGFVQKLDQFLNFPDIHYFSSESCLDAACNAIS